MLLVTASGCGNHSAATGSGGATSPPPPSAESTKDIDAGTAQRLDAVINQAMTAASIPGAIIGVWGPDGRYIRTFGVADKATGAPMNADFYSRIGSATKTFTVTGVLQLADQGKLGLDDPIGKYIDGVPEGNQITLRQLARGAAKRALQLHQHHRVPAGAVRRPAGATSRRRNYSLMHSPNFRCLRPGRDSSTPTPTRCCWAWWSRR